MKKTIKKVLITGGNGFAGSHLIDYILQEQPVYEVYCMISDRLSDRKKIAHVLTHPKFHEVICDLRESETVVKTIESIKPDLIFHLAAQSFVPASWKFPQLTIDTNIKGSVNLLEGIRLHSPQAKVFFCGTAEEYGLAQKPWKPLKENSPLNPNNPYGVTKLTQEFMGRVWHASFGLNILLARPFAHEGPRRGKEFATSDFALQVLAIKRGLQEPIINYGSLETVRDYIHVKDIVRMYWDILNSDFKLGEAYNICSGNETTIGELIKTYLKISGLEKKVKLQLNPKLVRPTQASYLVGNPSKMHKLIKRRPKYTVKDICKDMLAYWDENFEMPLIR